MSQQRYVNLTFQTDAFDAAHTILPRLVLYCSLDAHFMTERTALYLSLTLRQLDVDEHYSVRGPTLQRAVEEDLARGLLPFFVCSSLGTTNSCACDNLDEISAVAHTYGLWLHVDGAYGGSAMVCPENRHLLRGVARANSFGFNPWKLMLCHVDCTVAWFEDRRVVMQALNNGEHGIRTSEGVERAVPIAAQAEELRLRIVEERMPKLSVWRGGGLPTCPVMRRFSPPPL